jgi:hypothetical protein
MITRHTFRCFSPNANWSFLPIGGVVAYANSITPSGVGYESPAGTRPDAYLPDVIAVRQRCQHKQIAAAEEGRVPVQYGEQADRQHSRGNHQVFEAQ